MSRGNRCWTLLAVLAMVFGSTSAWAITYVSIDNVSTSSYPRITLQLSTDAAGLPLSAFALTEDGDPQALLPICYDVQTQPVDIIFCVDISRSMEDNIRAVADELQAHIDQIIQERPEIDFRFGLITYGQDSQPFLAEACPSSTGRYYGGPRNRTINGLWTSAQVITSLNNIACPGQNPPSCLAGGNEPAYHAVNCAVNSSPWRAGSIKRIILVSDENNDWAMGSSPTCNNDAIPFYSQAEIITTVNGISAKFYSWCNANIVCDGHDNGDGIAPENLICGVLDNEGCVSGFADFNPICAGTGGVSVTLDQDVAVLFQALQIDLLTGYTICYNAECCLPGIPRAINVVVTDGATNATDDATYTMVTCPAGNAPVVACWPGNPTNVTYGEAAQLCAVVTPGGATVTDVTATYNTGPGCNVTVPCTLSDSRWCFTLPGTCTDVCSPNNVINVTFRAEDACGLWDEQVCPITVTPAPPVVTCWNGNPTTFVYGTDLTLCASTEDLLSAVVDVRASYDIGGCVQANLPTQHVDGRWCITVPASCTRICGTATVTFTAYNECGGSASIQCSATAVNTPPAVACFTGNPVGFNWGEALTVCVTTADAENNVTGVTASYSLGAGCVVNNLPLTLVNGRWCVTIPPSCTQRCDAIAVNFTATDACGGTGTTACTIPLNNQPPTVACATSNPATILYGAAVTVCVNASDPNNNLPATGVTYSYNTGPGCSASGVATFTGGQYCVTIPASCTMLCGTGGNGNIAVSFTATDACGLSNSTTCNVGVVNNPPVAVCEAAPATFTYGVAVTKCVTVTDPNNNVTGVTASYNTGVAGCNFNGAATNMGGGRWCVTIPANCTMVCPSIPITFTVTDACGLTDVETCTLTRMPNPPSVTCWTGNTPIVYGTSGLVCAMVADADNNLTGVTATIPGCVTTPQTCVNQGGGRWCYTVPASCTSVCGSIQVVFLATDACGETGTVTCPVTITNTPPVVSCWSSNPPTFTYGQALTMCALVTDAENNVTGVTASYNTGVAGCNFTGPATNQGGGRWCITVPSNCTETCNSIAVTFTATDACGQTHSIPCTAVSNDPKPSLSCWGQNPVSYQWGQPLTLCALASDAGNNLTSVTASYDLGVGCIVSNQVLTLENGRYCITIPGTCTDYCGPLSVTFRATDACGHDSVIVCGATLSNQPPVIDCYVADRTPGTIDVLWGQPVLVQAMATDPNGNLAAVYYAYDNTTLVAEACADSGIAPNLGGNLYGITIPGNCTQVCGTFIVRFYALDACGLQTMEVCSVRVNNTAPVIECWLDNPLEAIEGDAVEMCVTVYDAENNVFPPHVWATINAGGDCGLPLTAYWNVDRWCITIPEGCTNGLGGQNLEVQFYAEDTCGLDVQRGCFVYITPRYCYDYGDLINYGTEECGLGGPSHAYEFYVENDIQYIRPDRLYAWLGENVDCDGAIHEDQDDGDQNDGLIAGAFGDLCVKYGNWMGCSEQTLEIFVNTGPAYAADPFPDPLILSAWYDANVDGDWGDSWPCGSDVEFNEWIIQDVVVVPGLNLIPVILDYRGPIDPNVLVNVRFRLGRSETFGRHGYSDPVGLPCQYRVGGEVEDYHLECPVNDCCMMCEVFPPVTMGNDFIEQPTMNLVAQWKNNRMRLFWDAIPGAEYYQVYKGGVETPLEEMTSIGFVAAGNATQWTDNTTLANLSEISVYRVAAFVVAPKTARSDADRGRWEMNEGSGECTADHSDLNNPACRPLCAEPSWGFDAEDPECEESSGVGYMHFSGYRYVGGTRCAEHLEVDNDWEYYQNYFQAWTRIRIFEQPTVNTGPYYILSNNSFDVLGGGFALRIDPGWYMQNGVRQYHNRLTGLVWNQDLNGGTGGWMTLQSPAPTPDNPDLWSVPLGQWSCVCMVVNGNRSMLIIDGRVVAAGDLSYVSDNNNAPLIIGAGYRHSTYPIEYPFRGDIDCVRITSIE